MDDNIITRYLVISSDYENGIEEYLEENKTKKIENKIEFPGMTNYFFKSGIVQVDKDPYLVILSLIINRNGLEDDLEKVIEESGKAMKLVEKVEMLGKKN